MEKKCPSCGTIITDFSKPYCPNCAIIVNKEGLEQIIPEQKISIKEINAPPKIQEYRRTCNSCGKVWYSLVSRENQLSTQTTCYGCQMCASIGERGGSFEQSSRNRDERENELVRLRTCPNCLSKNYTEEIISYEGKK